MFQDKDCNRIDFTLSEGAFSSKYQSVEPNDAVVNFTEKKIYFLKEYTVGHWYHPSIVTLELNRWMNKWKRASSNVERLVSL